MTNTPDPQRPARRKTRVVYPDFVLNDKLSYKARMLWLILDASDAQQRAKMPVLDWLCQQMSRLTLDGLRPMRPRKLKRLLHELVTAGYLEITTQTPAADAQDSELPDGECALVYTLMDEPFFGVKPDATLKPTKRCFDGEDMR